MSSSQIRRKYPIGAEIIPKKGVDFRVWAPDHNKVTLVLENFRGRKKEFKLNPEKNGYFSIFIPEAKAGYLYSYKLGTSKRLLADPASRFQPRGSIGFSEIIDPHFPWKEKNWKGIEIEKQIIYEMHIGTFTPEGTFEAAMHELEELAALGITVIEVMPINDFPGDFGWGYDGVNLFAPVKIYGRPEDVKRFINRAHQLGLAVILDVVYNHLGPEGNQLVEYAKDYLNKKSTTEWGDSINFDCPQVREYFLSNAKYWIEEFHFDGLRIDATPWLISSTPVHILEDITRAVRKANSRKKIIIGENEPQDSKLLKSYEEGGYGFDALWNDDFHHTASVRLTGKREAYYTDYLGSTQEFISSFKYGFLYQGQYYAWQKNNRGSPNLKIPSKSLVIFLENHDQVANSGTGKRLHQLTEVGNYKTLTCLLLLSPNTPMLFQGQEFGSSRPFLYFADHAEDLNKLVFKGRKDALAQFPRLATDEIKALLPNPADIKTFTSCKLDFTERKTHKETYSLHKDLIKLRKTDPVFKQIHKVKIDGAVLGTDSFLLRYFGGNNGDRLIIVNFGPDLYFNPCPEPLIVAGPGLDWEILWSSESPKYGGEGIPPYNIPYWKILGHSAVVLKTVKAKARKRRNSE